MVEDIKKEDTSIENCCFNDFQLSQITELDYEELASMIDAGKDIYDLNSFIKNSNHALFSPILVYSISFINKKKKDLTQYKYNIGIEKINNYKVLYTTLNEEIYALYFLKEKKAINEIECDFSEKEKEQYRIFRKGNKITDNKNDFINQINEYTNIIKDRNNDEEEYSLEALTYEKLCEIKRKEIISTFRLGYSVQERIIELLKKDKKFNEYPNLIFYEKNSDNILYKEIDRVLLLKGDADFELFKTYFSIVNKIKKFDNDGSILKLHNNSLNFIEIKRGIYSFEKQLSELEKRLNEKEDEDKKSKSKNNEKGENVSMSKNTFLNKQRTDLYYSIKNVKEFLALYNILGIQYNEINLLYIFDSNFSINFIQILLKLIKFEIYDDNILKLNDRYINLYLIHIQSDFEKIDIINRNKNENDLGNKITKLENNIKDNNIKFEKLEKENKDLKEKFEKENKDLKEKFEKENKDLKDKFEKENKDLKDKLEKENKDLKEKYEKVNQQLKKMFEISQNEKLIKKKIKSIPLKKILKEEKFEKFDILIGKNYHNLDISITKENINELILENKNYTTILDTKTFLRKMIFYNNNDDLINYSLYFSTFQSFDNIILLIDYDFINNFEFLKKEYIGKYEITIIIVDLSLYIAILVKCNNNNNKNTCIAKILNNTIPGFNNDKYEFYFNNNLVSYFKKLYQFNENIGNKTNDEIAIYNPNNMSYQYILKYIYMKNNNYNDNIYFNLDNNLIDFGFPMEVYINEKGYKNNFYFFPIQFHDNKIFENILQYFNKNNNNKHEVIELKYSDRILSLNTIVLYQININRDYFLTIIDETQNYSPAYVKLKVKFKKIKPGEIINMAKTNRKFIKENYIETIDLNSPSEKILFFISTMFYMNLKDIKILLLGDEMSQIKFYLSNILLKIPSFTHVTQNFDLNFGQCFGFIKQMFAGKSLINFLSKNSENMKLFNDKLKKEVINKKIIDFIESSKENEKYDIIFIDENFVNIIDSLTMPSFNIFIKIGLLKNMLKNEGIICFNLIGKNKMYYEQVKEIINKNFFILKDEKDYCNGYFILAKTSKIIDYANENKTQNLFKPEIHLNIKEYINNFLSKNEEKLIELSSSLKKKI